MLSFAVVLLGSHLHAQDSDAVLGNSGGWQRYDWLSPSAASANASGKWTSTASQPISDPFSVVNHGALWRQQVNATYTQPLVDSLTLSYQTDAVGVNGSSYLSPSDETFDNLSQEQRGGIDFQPIQQLKLSANVEDSIDDPDSTQASTEKRGAGVTADAALPYSSDLLLGVNSNDSTSLGTAAATDSAYDMQLKKPLGKAPLTAVLKGHLEDTAAGGNSGTRLPSLEQSLVWKPAETTTLQMGLRQQHYQSFPGVTNQLNEAVFADWSQTLLPEVTWHSYAEVLDSRGTEDVAPAVPIASGANGTAQSADPTNNLSVPTSFSDETLTFSTGPSFKLDHDISASVEYSNRIDRNPLPGEVEQEQRVSVSLKGTF